VRIPRRFVRNLFLSPLPDSRRVRMACYLTLKTQNTMNEPDAFQDLGVTFLVNNSGCYRRIQPILAFMMQNLDKPLKMSTLSKMAGLSPSGFFALFRSATGYAPNDYFIRARMQRARDLLERENLRVKEVAALMGYDDPFYFSRRFKLANGLAPNDYRRKKTVKKKFDRSDDPAVFSTVAEWNRMEPSEPQNSKFISIGQADSDGCTWSKSGPD
jgi:AraC-like DNA-binding protein